MDEELKKYLSEIIYELRKINETIDFMSGNRNYGMEDVYSKLKEVNSNLDKVYFALPDKRR